jgi:Phage capsid family
MEAMNRTARRRITAETFRPERVDEHGRPELVTGDATSGAPTASEPEPPAPAPEPPAPEPPAPAPAPPPAEATASGPAGLTTAEIVAALGLTPSGAHVTREPSPYLEAGGRISHTRGFFADLYAARARGDGEAGRRAAQFQAQLRDYVAAAMETGTGADVIPPAWGGQWYVDQIAQQRPMVSAFASAGITSPNPIPIPAFKDTTPSALVGDHVEGQPDAAGTVNFEQVTVTPKAKSGRAEITRELLDSSPALVDRIVSEALRESYSQITESTMAGVLAAGATVGPAGGATAATTEGAIRTALGLLPQTRFAPGRVVLPSGHVWGALVAADTPDGRPLIPYLGYGPTNAAGVAGTAYGSGGIAGVETRPAWALASGQVIIGAGPADAMSFESSLLEFRFAEKSGPELVEFNVWGYFGAVVLQKKGVILITSTAALASADVGEMLGAPESNGESNGSNGESRSGRGK